MGTSSRVKKCCGMGHTMLMHMNLTIAYSIVISNNNILNKLRTFHWSHDRWIHSCTFLWLGSAFIYIYTLHIIFHISVAQNTAFVLSVEKSIHSPFIIFPFIRGNTCGNETWWSAMTVDGTKKCCKGSGLWRNVTAGHDCLVVIVAPHWVDGGGAFAIAGDSSCVWLSLTLKESDNWSFLGSLLASVTC